MTVELSRSVGQSVGLVFANMQLLIPRFTRSPLSFPYVPLMLYISQGLPLPTLKKHIFRSCRKPNSVYSANRHAREQTAGNSEGEQRAQKGQQDASVRW
jgi:hypothetical protein